MIKLPLLSSFHVQIPYDHPAVLKFDISLFLDLLFIVLLKFLQIHSVLDEMEAFFFVVEFEEQIVVFTLFVIVFFMDFVVVSLITLTLKSVDPSLLFHSDFLIDLLFLLLSNGFEQLDVFLWEGLLYVIRGSFSDESFDYEFKLGLVVGFDLVGGGE